MMWCCCNPATMCDLVGFSDIFPPSPSAPSSEWPSPPTSIVIDGASGGTDVLRYERCLYGSNFSDVNAWMQNSGTFQFPTGVGAFGNYEIQIRDGNDPSDFYVILNYDYDEPSGNEIGLQIVTNGVERYNNRKSASKTPTNTLNLRVTRLSSSSIRVDSDVGGISTDTYTVSGAEYPTTESWLNTRMIGVVNSNVSPSLANTYITQMATSSSWD